MAFLGFWSGFGAANAPPPLVACYRAITLFPGPLYILYLAIVSWSNPCLRIQLSYPSHSTCLCNMYPTLSLAFVSYSISSLRILLHNQLSYPSLYLAVISISIHMPLYPTLSPAFVSFSISSFPFHLYIQLNIKQVSSPF